MPGWGWLPGGAGDAAVAPMLQGCAEGRVLGKEEPATALVGLQDGEGLQRGAAGRDGDAGRCTGSRAELGAAGCGEWKAAPQTCGHPEVW